VQLSERKTWVNTNHRRWFHAFKDIFAVCFILMYYFEVSLVICLFTVNWLGACTRVTLYRIMKLCLCVKDYVILDEGHKIKNPTNKCAKGVHTIRAQNRIVLSGTPIMNNLKVSFTAWIFCISVYYSAAVFSVPYYPTDCLWRAYP